VEERLRRRNKGRNSTYTHSHDAMSSSESSDFALSFAFRGSCFSFVGFSFSKELRFCLPVGDFILLLSTLFIIGVCDRVEDEKTKENGSV
jgi:hypothetical protein